ncbi:T9SS type B sorting domain-containing protein [Flavimarina sp. Hel_I_48]|uniref:T9SS type B sorting domain-containing protein n=1 Tax=Flavimarina sp. Hel_I_48 TaxID=1392488 RepID=UPI000691AA2D|nr:T9SS type B sorting domain-containing protein [Flavimarina sp. Hel_I_48]
MKPTLLFVLLFSGLRLCLGQGAANNWYFGSGAGISFETSPPRVLTNGALNTLEGCSSISNDNGQLLFYTDGSVIYQADGTIMSNGTGLTGSSSSTQSAIIIPKPLNNDIYYVFTVDEVGQEVMNGPLVTDGVNYSIVDFSNNPNGEVTEKNIHLIDFSAEKLSAVVMGCDSNTVWMVTLSTSLAKVPNIDSYYNFNTFYAYAITEDGVSTTPVKSTTGMQVGDPRGNLKFSPNGKKLACANGVSGLYLLDFNSLTGKVSNEESIGFYEAVRDSYGVEFSPNNRFLYTTSYNDLPTNALASEFISVIRQYDLESNSINGSTYVVDNQTLYRSSLQLGPDGKIYRSMSSTYFEGLPYLSVIENPNEKGAACNYMDKAINLGTGKSNQGLPPFNQSLFNRVDIIQNNISTSVLNLCEDETYTLKYNEISGADYQWSRNGVDLIGATSNELIIALGSNEPLPHTDEYQLSIDLRDGTCPRVGLASVNFYRTPVLPEEPLILSQCEDAATADGLSIFNLTQIEKQVIGTDPSFTVHYYDDIAAAQINDTVQAIDPIGYANARPRQTLYAYFDNFASCSLVAPFQLNVSSTQANTALLTTCDSDDTGFAAFDLTDANDQLLAGQSPDINITYYASSTGALLEDATEELLLEYKNSTPFTDTIFARLESNEQCFAISTVILKVFPLPAVSPLTDEVICANLSELVTISPEYDLDPGQTYSYLWMPTGQNTPELVTNLQGEHTLTVTNTTTGCSRSRSVRIEPRTVATIENIAVTDATDNNEAIITISGTGDFEFALNENGPYQASNVFTNLLPGFYTVFVRATQGCGTAQQEFNVIGFDKFFTPNGDGYNDRWQVKGINESVQPGTSIRIFDRYGKLLKELNPLSEGWDGTFNGYSLPSDDYWFYVKLEDGREFKSHFTLKR